MTEDLVLSQKQIPKLTFQPRHPSGTGWHLSPLDISMPAGTSFHGPERRSLVPYPFHLPLFAVRGPSFCSFQSHFLPPPTLQASLPLHLYLGPPQELGQTPGLSKATPTNSLSSSIHRIKKRREERTQLQPGPARLAAGNEGFCSEPKKRGTEAECGGSYSILVFRFPRKERENIVRCNSALDCELVPWFKSQLSHWLPWGLRYPARLLWYVLQVKTTFLYFLYLQGTPAFCFYWFQGSSFLPSQCRCDIGRSKTVPIPD